MRQAGEKRSRDSTRARIAFGAALGVAAVATALTPAPAAASTVDYVSSQHRIYYLADDGEKLDLTISAQGDKDTGDYVFQDTSATIASDPGSDAGCTAGSAHTVTCSKVGVLILSAAGQSEDDHITVNLDPTNVPDHPTAPVRTILRGNDGNDVINGSALRDDIYGGGGDDTINSGGGDDTSITGEGGLDTLTFANRPAGDDVTVELRPSIHSPAGRRHRGDEPARRGVEWIGRPAARRNRKHHRGRRQRRPHRGGQRTTR